MSPRSGDDQLRNAAQRLAYTMERDILDAQPADGELIGSEALLLERYGVSRTVLRAAVRILEHDGLAMMRRGPSGGLIARHPKTDVVTHAAELYLRHQGSSIASLVEARVAIEGHCVAWAAERLPTDAIQDLRKGVKHEKAMLGQGDRISYNVCAVDFHVKLAELSGNDALALFVRVLVEVTNARVPTTELRHSELEDSIHDHELITEAVVGGDVALARHHMIRHLRTIQRYSAVDATPWDLARLGERRVHAAQASE